MQTYADQAMTNSELFDAIRNPRPLSSKTYLFVSFHLTGSTALKYEFRYWNSVLYMFYRKLPQFMREFSEKYRSHTIPLTHWKLIGDEATFYKEIDSAHDLVRATSLVMMLKPIIDGQLGSYIAGLNAISNIDPDFQPLGECRQWTKCTMWLGQVTDKFEGGVLNPQGLDLFIDEFNDFIGPRIDEGFRVSKHGDTESITLSCELAYILNYAFQTPAFFPTGSPPQLKFKGLEELKGISNSKDYPIYVLEIHNAFTPLHMSQAVAWLNSSQTRSLLVRTLLGDNWLEFAFVEPPHCSPSQS